MSKSVDCWVACGSIGPEKAEEVAVSVGVLEQIQDVAVPVSEEERLVLSVHPVEMQVGRLSKSLFRWAVRNGSPRR